MHVTRHFSLTDETTPVSAPCSSAPGLCNVVNISTSSAWQPKKTQTLGFCDWLSIYQNHFRSDLPKIADGVVMCFDKEGVIETATLKKSRIEGSFETAVFVRCDGETVWFDGNVSKWGRSDNVFGYTFLGCLQMALLHKSAIGQGIPNPK